MLPTLPDDSVDLILTDPPYFRVKNLPWDRQWGTAEGFLAWLDLVLAEFHRVLRPNGSLYVFASPRMAARVEVLVGERFNVLNHIVWDKPEASHAAIYGEERFRLYVQKSERIVFAEHHGSDNHAKGVAGYAAKCEELRGFVFEPLRAYLRAECAATGLDRRELNGIIGSSTSGGGMMSHYIGNTNQWELPTEEHYAALAAATGRFQRPHATLREQYEGLREQYENLRRPFHATPERPYTDVWTFKTVQPSPGKHPCEKPPDLLRHIIQTSTREGAVVLDAFAGSGSTLQAAQALGREYIGIEKDAAWCERARSRLHSPLFAAAAD